MVTVTIKGGVRRINISETERRQLRRALEILHDIAQAPSELASTAGDALADVLDEVAPEGEQETQE